MSITLCSVNLTLMGSLFGIQQPRSGAEWAMIQSGTGNVPACSTSRFPAVTHKQIVFPFVVSLNGIDEP